MMDNRKQFLKLPYLQFDHFREFSFVRHAVFTRKGGVSHRPYDQLNIGFSTGDAPQNIVENRRRIFDCMGKKELVFMHQIHGDHILKIRNTASEDENKTGRNGGVGDAMITGEYGKNLVVQVADCQPVLLLDPIEEIVAVVHSGWRGSIADIAGKTVSVMKDEYKCNPENILAGIGPSLGPCCCEFTNYETEIPESLWKYRIPGSFNFDFWSLTSDQLMREGLRKANIQNSNVCTRCSSDLFFSYRKEKQTGRFAAVIGLTENDNIFSG